MYLCVSKPDSQQGQVPQPGRVEGSITGINPGASSTQDRQTINKTSKAGAIRGRKARYFIHDCILKGLAHDSQIIHELLSIFKCKYTRVFKGAEVLHPTFDTPLGYFGERISYSKHRASFLSEFCPTAWSSFFSPRDSLGQSEGRPNTCLPDPPFCHLYQQLLANQNQRPAAAIWASETISCGVDELKAESGDEF